MDKSTKEINFLPFFKNQNNSSNQPKLIYTLKHLSDNTENCFSRRKKKNKLMIKIFVKHRNFEHPVGVRNPDLKKYHISI